MVLMRSAPASMNCRWMSAMICGCVSTSRSLQPFRSLRHSSEATAPEGGLVQLCWLDHGAHGAVEDDDALGKQLAQRCARSGVFEASALATLRSSVGRTPRRGRWRR
jgi:hypothetical protein